MRKLEMIKRFQEIKNRSELKKEKSTFPMNVNQLQFDEDTSVTL